MDDITPDCEAHGTCLVPPLDETGQRTMELRGLLVSLRPTVDPGTVCRLFDADLDDLRMLALVEDELRALQPEERPDGERH